ncbi:MAG: DUF4190 domain-containing protein [Aeromicrobium sp.]
MSKRAMIFGIVGLIGFFILVVPVFLSPFAWYYGAVARREIDRAPGQFSGRGHATTGMVCGMIGSALLVLAVVVGAVIVGGLALLLTAEGGYSP